VAVALSVSLVWVSPAQASGSSVGPQNAWVIEEYAQQAAVQAAAASAAQAGSLTAAQAASVTNAVAATGVMSGGVTMASLKGGATIAGVVATTGVTVAGVAAGDVVMDQIFHSNTSTPTVTLTNPDYANPAGGGVSPDGAIWLPDASVEGDRWRLRLTSVYAGIHISSTGQVDLDSMPDAGYGYGSMTWTWFCAGSSPYSGTYDPSYPTGQPGTFMENGVIQEMLTQGWIASRVAEGQAAFGGSCPAADLSFRLVSYFWPWATPAGSGGVFIEGTPEFGQAPAPEDVPDPLNWVEQTVTCENAAGVSETLGQTVNFDSAGGLTLAGLDCPDGFLLQSSLIMKASKDAITGVITRVVISSYTRPKASPEDDVNHIPQGCLSAGAVCGPAWFWKEDDAPVVGHDPAEYPQPEDLFECRYGSSAAGWLVYSSLDPCVGLVPPKKNGDDTTVKDPLPDPPPPKGPEGFPPPNAGDDCDFSPLEILNPLNLFDVGKCVLVWAFKPDMNVIVPKFRQIRTQLASSPPAVSIDMFGQMFGPFLGLRSVESHCMGPHMVWDTPDVLGHSSTVDVYPMQACEGSVLYEVRSYLYPVSVFLILGSAVLLSLSILGATIGLKSPDDGLNV
jgi:hypothetical protein